MASFNINEHILNELSNVRESQQKMTEQMTAYHVKHLETITEIKEDVAALKVKAGIWGGISGVLSSLLVAVLAFFKFSK
jgi:hypothetical protein